MNYFKNIPPLYFVACVFDPRYKLDSLNDYLSLYYSCINLDDEIDFDVHAIIVESRKLILDLYSEFCSSSSQQLVFQS